jgi:hypothetical protein
MFAAVFLLFAAYSVGLFIWIIVLIATGDVSDRYPHGTGLLWTATVLVGCLAGASAVAWWMLRRKQPRRSVRVVVALLALAWLVEAVRLANPILIASTAAMAALAMGAAALPPGTSAPSPRPDQYPLTVWGRELD